MGQQIEGRPKWIGYQYHETPPTSKLLWTIALNTNTPHDKRTPVQRNTQNLPSTHFETITIREGLTFRLFVPGHSTWQEMLTHVGATVPSDRARKAEALTLAPPLRSPLRAWKWMAPVLASCLLPKILPLHVLPQHRRAYVFHSRRSPPLFGYVSTKPFPSLIMLLFGSPSLKSALLSEFFPFSEFWARPCFHPVPAHFSSRLSICVLSDSWGAFPSVLCVL